MFPRTKPKPKAEKGEEEKLLVKRFDMLARVRASILSQLARSLSIPRQTLPADLLLEFNVRRRNLRVVHVRVLLVVPDGLRDDGLPRRKGFGNDKVDEGGDEEAEREREEREKSAWS